MKLQVTHKLNNVDKKLMIYTGHLELTETTVRPRVALPLQPLPLQQDHWNATIRFPAAVIGKRFDGQRF